MASSSRSLVRSMTRSSGRCHSAVDQARFVHTLVPSSPPAHPLHIVPFQRTRTPTIHAPPTPRAPSCGSHCGAASRPAHHGPAVPDGRPARATPSQMEMTLNRQPLPSVGADAQLSSPSPPRARYWRSPSARLPRQRPPPIRCPPGPAPGSSPSPGPAPSRFRCRPPGTRRWSRARERRRVPPRSGSASAPGSDSSSRTSPRTRTVRPIRDTSAPMRDCRCSAAIWSST